VLGELIAGILLGKSLLGVIPIDPADPLTTVVRHVAEVGVAILLFEIGLETDVRAMARVGGAAGAVAVVGVLLPLGLGVAYWLSPVNPWAEAVGAVGKGATALFVGAALTATSVGITARVLSDLKRMNTVEAKLILGAAVIDDVLGLVLLGTVSGIAAGVAVSLLGVARSLAVAIGFLVVAVAVGLTAAPRLFDLIQRMRARGVLPIMGLATALGVAALAYGAGSAMIIGAFAAGIILAGTKQRAIIEQGIRPVTDIFAPVFFLSIGAAVDVRAFAEAPVLIVGGSLFVIAMAGKLAAGWAPFWLRCNNAAVGIGMAPRGEVGLIFATIGLATGVLSRQLFTAILLMVMATTFVAPPLLKWAFARGGSTADRGPSPAPGAER
jgi:Kef-type K+ transport system membrane component KefB